MNTKEKVDKAPKISKLGTPARLVTVAGLAGAAHRRAPPRRGRRGGGRARRLRRACTASASRSHRFPDLSNHTCCRACSTCSMTICHTSTTHF